MELSPLAAVLTPHAPLGDRIEGFLAHLVALCGAQGALAELPVGGVANGGAVLAFQHGALDAAADDLTSLPLRCGGRLAVAPGAAPPPGVLDLAAELLASAWEQMAAASRRDQDEHAMSAVLHEMNNGLTPLLCHASESVQREAFRLRALVEALRHLRGRSRPRGLVYAGVYLERAKKILGKTRGGTFPVEVDVAPDCAQRTIGPEQGELLPNLLRAGFALRTLSGETPLELRARLDAAGALVLEVRRATSAARALVGALPREALVGADLAVAATADAVSVVFTLRAQPRVVVFGPGWEGLGDLLGTVGLGVERGETLEEALAAARRAPEPWAILATPPVAGQIGRLRAQMYAYPELMGLSMRCVALDGDGAPLGLRPEQEGDVDLREVVSGSSRA